MAEPSRAPAGLPLVLDTGWRAADADPPDGIAGIDRLDFRPADPVSDQARRGGVRWYRVLVDLSPFVGQPLAFAADGLRDVDEAWFDGVPIGGLGGFPPGPETAHFVARVYPLPTDRVDEAGPRELVLRVWHGRRDGSVFRSPPVIDRLDRLERRRSLRDQGVVLFVVAALVVAGLLVLFAFHARSPADYLLFAGFAVSLGLWVTTGHSRLEELPFPLSAVFRAGLVALSATAVCYGAAMLRFLGGMPLVHRILLPVLGLLAPLAILLPDTEGLVLPVLLFRWSFAALLLDLLVRFGAAAIRRRRLARTDLLGHVAFVLAAIPVAGLLPGAELPRIDLSGRVLLFGVLFLCLASAVLLRMSEEIRRYRLAGLTDPGTRLWNREALYEEIAERGEAVRRGRGRLRPPPGRPRPVPGVERREGAGRGGPNPPPRGPGAHRRLAAERPRGPLRRRRVRRRRRRRRSRDAPGARRAAAKRDRGGGREGERRRAHERVDRDGALRPGAPPHARGPPPRGGPGPLGGAGGGAGRDPRGSPDPFREVGAATLRFP
jgi:hypothetical protein